MRVTAEVKQRTQERLLHVGRKLLADKGLEGMTTREVALAAGLAHGTLFNYFPTKEALALAVCHQLLTEAEEAFVRQRRGDEELEEELFAHVAAGLHALAPLRTTAGSLLAAALRPVVALGESAPPVASRRHAPSAGASSAEAAVVADSSSTAAAADGGLPSGDPYALQARHLQTVAELLTRHRGATAAGPVALHLYWSLYLGVLAWWSADDSPHQEDTLAVLDQSLRMFTASLGGAAPSPAAEPTHGS